MGESSESVCVEEREGDDTVRGASRAGCRRRLEGVGEYNPTWFGVVWCVAVWCDGVCCGVV